MCFSGITYATWVFLSLAVLPDLVDEFFIGEYAARQQNLDHATIIQLHATGIDTP